jgi:hypothetical protein
VKKTLGDIEEELKQVHMALFITAMMKESTNYEEALNGKKQLIKN